MEFMGNIMSVANSLKNFVAPMVLVAAFATNADAAGLIPGQCYAKADAEAVLKQEGQMPIIVGSRLTLGTERPANVFFVNKQGYGYNVEGNAPLGQKATELCVAAVFKNTNLGSLDQDTPPEWAKNIKTTGNGIDIKKAYQNGARIILGAQTFTPKADGTETLGKYIVVLGSTDKFANVLSVDLSGRPDTSFDMNNFGVTQNMNNLLSQTVGQSTYSPTLAVK